MLYGPEPMKPLSDLLKRFKKPEQSSRDPRQVQIEKEVLIALRSARPRGIELPNDSPELAAACVQLLKDNPELTAVKGNHGLTLFHREDLDPTLSPETRDALRQSGHLINRDSTEVKHG